MLGQDPLLINRLRSRHDSHRIQCDSQRQSYGMDKRFGHPEMRVRV